jgi:lipopolysaccharide transport system permease protein
MANGRSSALASIDRVSTSKLEAADPAAPTTRPATEPELRSDRTVVIKPASRWPHLDVPELWHYRELLQTLVWRDIVVRYKQTFLGVAWALLVPIFTATVYIIVFGKFADFPAGEVPYPALVIGGVLPMQYFASSLTGSSLSLAANLQLVTKVYFPRALLPLAAVIVPMVDLVVGLPVLIALMWIYETWPGGIEVLMAPVFLGLALVAALGAGFFLSALNVRYRDVRYMIPVFLQVLPLLSGVMYAVEEIPVKWQWILAFNPMTAVIAGLRWAVLDANTPNLGQTAVGVGVTLVLFFGGLAVFRASEPRFADTI